MILLDFLVNNVDRNKNNYGIIVSEYGEVKFSPLFDNSTIDMSYIPKEYQKLNGYLIHKQVLLNCLYENYYEDIKYFTNTCWKNKDQIMSKVAVLSKSELDSEETERLMSIIEANTNMIVEKEESRQKEKGEQPLEEAPKLVRTQQNLNNQGKINLVFILLSISLILIFTTLMLLFKMN